MSGQEGSVGGLGMGNGWVSHSCSSSQPRKCNGKMMRVKAGAHGGQNS